MTEVSRYETVGDVRQEVDAVFGLKGLRSAGGAFFPYRRALVFGIIDEQDKRVGDAYCPLPDGGHISESYFPENAQVGDGLRFRVVRGAGVLTLSADTVRSTDVDEVTAGFMRNAPYSSRTFRLRNPESELLIVHATSLLAPTNHTGIDRCGIQTIDNSRPLRSEIVYTYDETYMPGDGVDIQLIH